MTAEKPWYNVNANEAIESLHSNPRGLSQEEAKKRLEQFGPNELEEKEKSSPWMLLLEQFKNFLIIILLVAVVLAAILGEVADAIVLTRSGKL